MKFLNKDETEINIALMSVLNQDVIDKLIANMSYLKAMGHESVDIVLENVVLSDVPKITVSYDSCSHCGHKKIESE